MTEQFVKDVEMNEQEFKKYLERLATTLHEKTMEFYKAYPEYNIKGGAKGCLSLKLFENAMFIENSWGAEKRININKERENGKWKTQQNSL